MDPGARGDAIPSEDDAVVEKRLSQQSTHSYLAAVPDVRIYARTEVVSSLLYD